MPDQCGSAAVCVFQRSDPQQRAGLLNQILVSLGQQVLSGLAGGVLGRVHAAAAHVRVPLESESPAMH